MATDGDLDMGFGAEGKVFMTPEGSGTGYYGRSIAIQSDGKIIMAGSALGADSVHFLVARYDIDGTLDTTFGANGKVFISNQAGCCIDEKAYSVAIQSDGKIVVAGSTGHTVTQAYDLFLVRLNINGTPDGTFGNDGKVITDLGSDHDGIYSIAIQSDGKIVAAGKKGGDFAVVRYDTSGTLDNSFSGNGIKISDIGSDDKAQGIAIQPDGKIVVAGSSGDKSTVVRYNAGGILDITFGDSGIAIIEHMVGESHGVAIQRDGKIVVVGYISGWSTGNDFFLYRYKSDGILDSTFDTDGKVYTDFADDDRAYGVAIQSDGKIIVVGSSKKGVENRFAMARYRTNGLLDETFDDADGRVVTELGGSNDIAFSVAIQSDGKIIVGGKSDQEGNSGFSVLRYQGTAKIQTLAPIYYLIQ